MSMVYRESSFDCLSLQWISLYPTSLGLQMAFFMKRANRDYIVFERNDISGLKYD